MTSTGADPHILPSFDFTLPDFDDDPLTDLFTDPTEEDLRCIFDLDSPETTAPPEATASPEATETAMTGLSQLVSIRIPTSTLKRLKAAAKARGLPYQTHINDVLRQSLT